MDIKRLYLPEFTLESACTECGRMIVKDFEDEYLSYPPMNKPFDMIFWCGGDGCGHEHIRKVRLGVSLTFVGNKHEELKNE